MKEVNKNLSQIARLYTPSDNLTNILNNFRVLKPGFEKKENTEFNYSDYNFSNCSTDEQENFINTQLKPFETLVCNTIYDKSGSLIDWYQIYQLMINPIYKNTAKIARKVIYSSMIPNRPIGDKAINTWNGLQIIDLDIKDAELAKILKPKIFNELKKYHWFLGICTSASGNSLHIWTKITPLSIKHDNKKVEYLCNFRHKYSYIYIVLSKFSTELGYDEETITSYMDMAMSKPQQGIFITTDFNPIMNMNFMDCRLDVNFESALNFGLESIDWISHPSLKKIFAKLEWFNNENYDDNINVEVSDLSNTNDRDLSKNYKKHYKHAQRWQLANTLTNIYGYEKALKYMLEICKETPYKEIKGDVKTAQIHNKPISIWAVKQLNQYHGFKIKFNTEENIYEEQQNSLLDVNNKEISEQPTGLEQISNIVRFNIKNNQYLSDIKDDIINNLSQITLLEAGAGYGKTEMIKSLKAKTCLILPFTSTIKSKIEKSEVTEDWLYYYGNKKVQLDDLLGNRNMAMTIDKFSRLNLMELDQADFEYIVLDESHLIFTSSYRDVMAPTMQRLANCKAKVIMMTGTPTGELTFFPGIKHIKVIKEDNRIKDFEIHFCNSQTEQRIEMCKMMANDIKEGRKVLFPTNNGMLYYNEITGLIQMLLDKDNFGRQINSFYYKKSNYGDETMDNINFNKSIGNNDLIMCTTYLSVGVDICDKYPFSVYFNELWIPQDVEQFANRLRNNDLYVKMILPKNDNDGYPINYYTKNPLDLSFDNEQLLLAHDLIKTCNDMIERNNEESKYNPLIQSLISQNKYLKYDENSCKYFIDETTYKLKIFEERYATYNKQLLIMIEGMKYYGYTINTIEHKEVIPDDKLQEVQELLKACKTRRYNEVTTETFNFLYKINDANIEIYKDILKGNLDIMKGKDEENTRIREDNGLYVNSIEIFEKNAPIIISLYKYYNCETIIDIYKYCLNEKTNRINYTKLTRIRRFISIVANLKKHRLDLPILKFIVESKKFALSNPTVNKTSFESFLKNISVSLANNIRNVIVEDKSLLEIIYNNLKELFKVIIITKQQGNNVSLSPFELLWDYKDSLDNVYGGINTKLFFLQDLVNNIDTTEVETDISILPKINENEDVPELELTNKETIKNINICNVINKEYGYYDYSDKDGSNDRFIEKQKNTNSLRDILFAKLNLRKDNEPEIIDDKQDINDSIDDFLFDDDFN